MPTVDDVLAGLTAIANNGRSLAVGWHLAFGALLLAVGAGWRPRYRTAGLLLLPPIVSVSVLAWSTANPFNGVLFAALAVLLARRARGFGDQQVTIRRSSLMLAGALLVAFGWVYPHFLKADHWSEYLYAAPLGLLPCPTLSAIVGLALILDLAQFTAWSTVLAAAASTYGLIGVFGLGVMLDYALLAGAAVLVVAARQQRRSHASDDIRLAVSKRNAA